MPREFKLPMAEEEVDQELSILVTDIGLLYRKYFNRQVRDIGLTAVQWQVLSYLARYEGITQSGLADLLNKGKSPIGKTLDALETAGWITREASPGDRRAKRLYLTGRLNEIQDRLLSVMEEMNGTAEKGLSAGAVEQVRAGLFTIRQNLRDELEE